MEGAILSCRMVILPSDIMSALKRAAAFDVTFVCTQCTSYSRKCAVALVLVSKVVRYNKTTVALE